ncbi:MAG: hypothetical protein Q9207_002928 [Kuettlingeria erythrocarpa]
MAPISKLPGWRSASRAQEKKREEERRAAPTASAPQTVNERIEARRVRTLASLGSKVAKPAAKLEAGIRRREHPLWVSTGKPAAKPCFVKSGPDAATEAPKKRKKVARFARGPACVSDVQTRRDYEVEWHVDRRDRGPVDYKANRHHRVDGYDLFYGSDCEFSDDE